MPTEKPRGSTAVGEPLPRDESVRARMSRQRRSDTKPEIELRKELFRRGLRFRLQTVVPGRPRRTIDIALPAKRVAVFVDGCFWHGCPEHATQPTSNHDWWRAKLEANRARDEDTSSCLVSQGWEVVRVWEHETTGNAADRVEEAVRKVGAARPEGRDTAIS